MSSSAGVTPLPASILSKSSSSIRGEDRISSLPEDQIVQILSLLPTIKDKIRTGALSRRWQYLWTHVPKLRFDEGDFRKDTADFIRNVNKTMFVLCSVGGGSRLKNFVVKMSYEPRYESEVNVWTQFAARSECERFSLSLLTKKTQQVELYTLPQLLYTNSSFRILSFTDCNVVPRGPVSWKSLQKLSLHGGDFSSDAMDKILAGSPALEIVHLELRRGEYHFNFGNSAVKKFTAWALSHTGSGGSEASSLVVSGPNIESVHVVGTFQTFTLTRMTSLVKVKLRGHPFVREDLVLSRQLLCGLANAQSLKLDTLAIQGIPMMREDNVLPLLSKCRCLTIETLLWKTYPSAIANLLKITPEIETLVVKAGPVDLFQLLQLLSSQHDSPNIDDQYWISQDSETGLLKHLRTVKFENFVLYRDTYAYPFVRFVLKNAKVLEKIIIYMERERKGIHTSIYDETFKMLSSFPRSSPDAELLVYQ